MIKILKSYDIPPILISAIDIMYQNTANIVTPDGDSKLFVIEVEVWHTIVPYSFKYF